MLFRSGSSHVGGGGVRGCGSGGLLARYGGGGAVALAPSPAVAANFFFKLKIRLCGAWYIVRHKSPTLSVAHVLSAPQNKNLVATILWRTHRAPQNSKLVRHR